MILAKFEIYQSENYWCARGIGEDIFTQGETLDELMENLKEACELHFEEEIEKGEEVRVLSISELEVAAGAKTAGC